MDWRPATYGQRNRWQREFPRWPPPSAARIVFGSWTNMMLAAGYQPYNHPLAKSRSAISTIDVMNDALSSAGLPELSSVVAETQRLVDTMLSAVREGCRRFKSCLPD